MSLGENVGNVGLLFFVCRGKFTSADFVCSERGGVGAGRSLWLAHAVRRAPEASTESEKSCSSLRCNVSFSPTHSALFY